MSKTNWKLVREQLYERCQGHCELCGRQLGDSWAIHHRKLRSRGGKDNLANLSALHHWCHNIGTESVHLQVDKATQSGHIVSAYKYAHEVPMRLPDGTWVLLDDDGNYEKLGRIVSDPREYNIGVVVEEITPEQAGKYLENNAKHREISQKRVDKYVAALQAGQWQLNGKVIIFDEYGRVQNGQHRLLACVQSGVNLTTLVVRGIKVAAFEKKEENQ